MGSLPYPQIGFTLPPTTASLSTDSFYNNGNNNNAQSIISRVSISPNNCTPTKINDGLTNIYLRENENISSC